MFWALEQRQKAFRDAIASEADRKLIAQMVPFAKEKGITTIHELAKELEDERCRKERDK